MAASSIGLVFLGSLRLPKKKVSKWRVPSWRVSSGFFAPRIVAWLGVVRQMLFPVWKHGVWGSRQSSLHFLLLPDIKSFVSCVFEQILTKMTKIIQVLYRKNVDKDGIKKSILRNAIPISKHHLHDNLFLKLIFFVNYLTKEEVATNNDTKLPSSHSIAPPLHFSPLLHQPQMFPMRRLGSWKLLLPVGSMYGISSTFSWFSW